MSKKRANAAASSRRTPDDRARSLRAAMSPFDPYVLLGSIAGMTTMPSNAPNGLRLGRLAEIAASLPESAGLPPTRTRILRDLTTGADIVALMAGAEDPPECPVTEPITFEGHVYSILSAQEEELVYRGQCLFDAFAELARASSVGELDAGVDLIRLVLALADGVVRRAGFPLGAAPARVPGVDVDGLSADHISAVSSSEAELGALAGEVGVDSAVLDVLSSSFGDGDPLAANEEGTMSFRPIVRRSDGAAVVVPDYLIHALGRELLRRADAVGQLPALAEALADTAHESEVRALVTLLAFREFAIAIPPSGIPGIRESVFMADTDTAVVLMTVSDPLATFVETEARSWWMPDEAETDAIEARLTELVDWTRSHATGPLDVLVVVSTANPPARAFYFGIRRGPADTLMLGLTPASLVTIATIEAGDPLALVRYARSREELRANTEVLVFNPLDEFALYHAYDYSFYMDDERARPTLLSITPGQGLDLRLRAMERVNPMSTLGPDGSRHVELIGRYESRAPIFGPLGASQPALFVRTPSFDCWVLGAPYVQCPPELRGFYDDLVNGVAYWVWQLGPEVAARAAHAASGTITVLVDLEDKDEWAKGTAPTNEPSPTDFSYSIDVPTSTLVIGLEPSFRAGIFRWDNRGERLLVGVLCEAFLEILGIPDPSFVTIPEIIERVAPVGLRKMIIMLPDDPEHQVGSDAGLPPAPRVAPWESNLNLDIVAQAFARDGRRPGPAGSVAEQSALVNAAVSTWYSALEAEVASLASDGLIQALLTLNEAVLRETALAAIQTPTRLACFGQYSDIVAEIRKETQENANASLAQRFLIEYVVAKPPTGRLSLSRARHARLLALANSIVNYGFVSDLTKEGIAQTAAKVLPSGRLGLERTSYEQGRDAYILRATRTQVDFAVDRFESFWHDGGRSATAPPDELEAAFRAEFGYPLTELGAVLAELVNRAIEDGAQVVTDRRVAVVAHLARRLRWDSARIEAILDDLTLRPRADFLNPVGFRPFDVYPWRFNRKLSLLRRPIVVVASPEGDLLSWGWRSLVASGRYLLDLLVSGRLDAQSPELLAFKSTLGEEQANEFADDVEAIAQKLGFTTRKKVDQFNGQRMQQDGNDLGDVDVLAVDAGSRRIWAIECKNLAMAKTPWELSSDIQGFEDPDKGMIAKHQRRAAWMDAHLGDVLAHLGLSGAWTVVPIIAVRSDLLAKYIKPMAMPIVYVGDLADSLSRSTPAALLPARAPQATPSGSQMNLAIRPKSARRRRRH